MSSHRHLIKIVENKTLMEQCPQNRNILKGTEDIWGGGRGCLYGKTPLRRTPHIRATLLLIPMPVLQRCNYITLEVDVMYVNGIHFIDTISCHIKFVMKEDIVNAEDSTMQNSTKQVKCVYMQQGFKADNILMGVQSECIRGDLVDTEVNLDICSND